MIALGVVPQRARTTMTAVVSSAARPGFVLPTSTNVVRGELVTRVRNFRVVGISGPPSWGAEGPQYTWVFRFGRFGR